MSKVFVLGAGGFGIAISKFLNENGHQVALWCRNAEKAYNLSIERENVKLLPGVKLVREIKVVSDLRLVPDYEVIIFALPSASIRQVAGQVKDYLNENHLLISLSKGIEDNSFLSMSQVIEEVSGLKNVVAVSGPSHAEEIAEGNPTSLVAACKDTEKAKLAQKLLMSPKMRVYINEDRIGVELGGALKNCIAMACGVTDGMVLGSNAKAALMTRGLAEISRLGVAMGAHKDTFLGLSGVGDLIVTCTSPYSRNREAGWLIGQGNAPEDAISKVGKTVEGYGTVISAYHLSQKLGVEMPIIESMYRVLNDKKSITESLSILMERPGRNEIDEI